MAIRRVKTTDLFTPATGGLDTFGPVFTVGKRSLVCRVFPATGEDLEADDMFELHAVLDYDEDTLAPSRTYAVKESDPVAASSYGLLIGQNNTQGEIMLRGQYAWKKVVASTAAIGVQGIQGYEKVE